MCTTVPGVVPVPPFQNSEQYSTLSLAGAVVMKVEVFLSNTASGMPLMAQVVAPVAALMAGAAGTMKSTVAATAVPVEMVLPPGPLSSLGVTLSVSRVPAAVAACKVALGT